MVKFEDKVAEVGERMVVMNSLGMVAGWGEVERVSGIYAWLGGEKFRSRSIGGKFRKVSNMSLMMMTLEDAAEYIPQTMYAQASTCPWLREIFEKKLSEEEEEKRANAGRVFEMKEEENRRKEEEKKRLKDEERKKREAEKRRAKKKRYKENLKRRKEEKFRKAEEGIAAEFKKLEEKENGYDTGNPPSFQKD